jgi:hypothetical protein
MDTQYPLGGLVATRVGTEKNDLIFWKITERNGERIRLNRLKPSFTVKGNPVPGEVDPHEHSIHRKIVSTYGNELLAPIIINGFAAGFRPWGNPVKRMGRGGKRIGAGRKKGSGPGRKAITKGITLTAEEWAQLKVLCGSTGVSEYIRRAVFTPERNLQKD